MEEYTSSNKTFQVDEDGFLLDFNDYCDEWVELVRKQENIKEITEKHMIVINKLREHYEEYKKAPVIRTLIVKTGMGLREIYKLFPSGPGKGACRIAGLTKPTGCI